MTITLRVSLFACARCWATFQLWIWNLVAKPLESLFLWVAQAGTAPSSAVAPDGGSLDPVCYMFGVKRGRSRADVCSHQQPDSKSGFIPLWCLLECLECEVTLDKSMSEEHAFLFCSCLNSFSFSFQEAECWLKSISYWNLWAVKPGQSYEAKLQDTNGKDWSLIS